MMDNPDLILDGVQHESIRWISHAIDLATAWWPVRWLVAKVSYRLYNLALQDLDLKPIK